MLLDPIQNCRSLTNQYLRAIDSEESDFDSIIAKISIIVFPIILLITMILDVAKYEVSQEKKVVDLVTDLHENGPNIVKVIAIGAAFVQCTPDEIANLGTNPQLHRIGNNLLQGFGLNIDLQEMECNPVAQVLRSCDCI